MEWSWCPLLTVLRKSWRSVTLASGIVSAIADFASSTVEFSRACLVTAHTFCCRVCRGRPIMSYVASKALMQLRVAMCQTGAGSAGARCASGPPRLSPLHRAPVHARLKLIPSSQRPPSFALRGLSDFWAKNYTAIKTANAKLPILLRESSGTVAKLTATYGAQAPSFF